MPWYQIHTYVDVALAFVQRFAVPIAIVFLGVMAISLSGEPKFKP